MGTKTPVAITNAGPFFGRTSIITFRTYSIHSVIAVAVELQNRALWRFIMLRSYPIVLVSLDFPEFHSESLYTLVHT